MTAGGDFIPSDQAFDAAPDYPVIFGVRMTPMVTGILVGLVGLAGAAALLYYMVLPEWDQYQQLKTKVEQTEDEIQQQQATLKKIDDAKKDLEVAKEQRDDVLKLFANQSALDTLLLDLNKRIDQRNADLPKRRTQKVDACFGEISSTLQKLGLRGSFPKSDFLKGLVKFEDKVGDLATKAQLKKFEPQVTTSGIITDGAYGAQVNGKLKRQVATVEFVGNYDQTAAILQAIERLQPLLVLKELQTTLSPKSKDRIYPITDPYRTSQCQPEPEIATTFRLEALLPLSTDEAAKVVQQQTAAQQPKK